MKICTSIILGVFLMCMAAAAAKADDLKEGKWTMTMVTHMDNMPPEMAGNGQDMKITATNCLSRQNPVPKFSRSANMDNYCQQTHDTHGNTVTFHMTCNHNDFQMESSGSMTYTGDTMQGHVKSHQAQAGGQSMDTSVDITGQYMGGTCD